MSLSNNVYEVIACAQRKVYLLNGIKDELNAQIEIISASVSNCQEGKKAMEKLTTIGYLIDQMINRYEEDVNYYTSLGGLQ